MPLSENSSEIAAKYSSRRRVKAATGKTVNARDFPLFPARLNELADVGLKTCGDETNPPDLTIFF
jgi:hypothetical protein